MPNHMDLTVNTMYKSFMIKQRHKHDYNSVQIVYIKLEPIQGVELGNKSEIETIHVTK